MDEEGEMDDKQQIDEVFVREQKKIMQYVRRKVMGISEMDAEDIVAEVLINLFNRADLAQPIENLTAYFYRSIKNKIVDYLRRPKRTVSLDQMEGDREKPLVDRIVDPSGNLDEALERQELQERINTALLQLKPNQRRVWIATEIEGYSFKELAQLWDEPIGTLLSRKNRATKQLQKILEDVRRGG